MAAGQTNWPYVINLGNSIIGVSVLAMPFCFKECGVILGMLLLLCCGWLTHISCKLLVKAAFQSRRRSYQYLAFHAVGQAGKLFVEICMIGLLLGTCIAFFVIMGDLGPAIVSKIMGIENTDNLRTGMLIVMALCISLPLALLRNLESLSNINAISLGFYTVFIAEVFTAAFPNLWSGLWVTKVSYWNPEGVFKCLPIFSLAFSCQTQLFVMYDALAEPSLQRMTHITKSAIGMCMSVYMCVGFFGYVAFCDDEVLGDILLNFHPTIFSEAVKFGFVLAVAVSFPLMVFPCRASIYTLCFAKTQSSHDNITGSMIIPPFHFNIITTVIVMGTMVIGILTPNIEFILAMTGATMGSLICYICPAIMFISIMSMTKTTNKATAQFVLFLGVTILLASTYVTLNTQVTQKNAEESVIKVVPQEDLLVPVDQPLDHPIENNQDNSPLVDDTGGGEGDKVRRDEEGIAADKEEDDVKASEVDNENLDESDKRQEPPNPQAPLDGDEEDEHQDQEGSKEEKAENDAGDESPKENADTKDEKIEKEPSVDDTEVKETEDKKKEDAEEANSLLKELKEQQEVQKQLIEEQKEIIQDLKQHQKEAHGESAREAERLEHELQPAAQQPVVRDLAQQLAQQPVVQDPAQQLAQQPVVQDPAQQLAQQPVAQDPAQQLAQQPVAQQLIGQQPVVNQAIPQLVANQGIQQPIINQVAQQPIANQVAQQPIANQVAQQPIANQVAQQGGQPLVNQKPIAQQSIAQQLQPIPKQQPVKQQAVGLEQAGKPAIVQQGAAEVPGDLNPSANDKLNSLGNSRGKQVIVEDTRGAGRQQPVLIQQELAQGANNQMVHESQNIQQVVKKSSGNANTNVKKSHARS